MPTLTRDDPSSDLSELLNLVAEGDEDARGQLFRRLYYELRQRAHRELVRQPPNLTLWATGLVHDTFIKLCRQKNVRWRNRRHFLAVSAMAMRSILVDHARRKGRRKRSAPGHREMLDHLLDAYQQEFAERVIDLIDLDDALKHLQVEDPDAAELVHLRFFLQMSMSEISELTGKPLRNLERLWRSTRLQLRELLDSPSVEGREDPES